MLESAGEKQLSQFIRNRVVIALGANAIGTWGEPRQTLIACLQKLESIGLSDLQLSPVYQTKAWGGVRQPDFLNLVATGSCAILPRQLLDIFKQIERQSGRRLLRRNAMRPLDIDLIDYRGWRINTQHHTRRAKLVLPHPLISERPFVLAPLADLLPAWRHPISGRTAQAMLRRLGGRKRFLLQKALMRVDSLDQTCD